MTNKQYMQTRTITGRYIMRLEDSIFEKGEAHCERIVSSLLVYNKVCSLK